MCSSICKSLHFALRPFISGRINSFIRSVVLSCHGSLVDLPLKEFRYVQLQFSSVTFGSAQFGSAQLDSVQLICAFLYTFVHSESFVHSFVHR